MAQQSDKAEAVAANSAEVAENSAENARLIEKKGTVRDQRDMQRMGKMQELWRNFCFVTIFGFTMVLIATWEAQLSANIFGLINGGTGGLIWMYIGTFFGFLAAIISMAEMASIIDRAPTTGDQYHWVSEFAPPSAQQFLSYIVGWLCVLGWQVGNTTIAFLSSQQIQGLIILNNPDYLPQRLPTVELIVLILHLGGFFAILIPLWVCGERSSAKEVFTTFTDGGGWGSTGLSCLIGMLSPIFSFIGPDSATHMSEELRDASKSLPRAMIATAIVNGAMGFVMLCTFCMLVGDVDAILASPTGQPFIQVFYNATGSVAGASAMTSMMIVMATFGCVTNIATSSRQIWAFARDRGLPFSKWLAHMGDILIILIESWSEFVRPGWDIPLNSVMVSYAIAVLLSLINIGSTVALNIITSLGTGALISSYIVSISCVTLKRLRGEPLLPSYFSLGTYGLPLNIVSVLFLTLAFIMTFFPTTPNPEPAAMNWNILVFGVVVVFSVAYYFVRGRYRYAGPVEYVKKN
ncbi:Nn.00g075420.m01.CDS01 [Neocucurbitaria sp. VM-36]